MALTCEDLRRLIDEEARLDTSAVREHLDGCPQCRTAVSRWTQVATELRDLGGEAPPPFLHGRVMAHVRAQRLASKRLWWTPALATALLVVIVSVWHSPIEAPGPPPLGAPVPTSLPVPASSASPGVRPAPVAPGPLRGVRRPSEAGIRCLAVGSDGTTRPVRLPEAWAPGPTVEWAVLVAPSGEVRPEDEAAAIPFETLEILASASLPAGRHLLRRAPLATP
jgi:hypothetical protein